MMNQLRNKLTMLLLAVLTLGFAAACQNGAPASVPGSAPTATVEASSSAATGTISTTTPSVETEVAVTIPAEGQGAPSEPPAAATLEMFCSEGDDFETCGGGPTAVTGEIASGAVDFSPDLYPEPTVALIDVSNLLQGRPEVFVEEQGQILGFLTEPLFPQPGRFHINLPIMPTAASIDVDNDGEDDPGVQIFALAAASNLINDSYLQQLEQLPKVVSYLQDIGSGAITEGTFLVFAPDAEQGFPSAWGEDGQWFTADDPSVPLPAGYTLATLEADGTVTLDRSPQLTMNTVERADQASPDFSDQGILESFESLMAVLKERYAYTELRQLDWDAVRAEYLPAVEEADANEDLVAYFLVLSELAKSVNDTHVAAANTTNVEAIVAQVRAFGDQTGSGIGASTIAISDEANPAGPGDTILVLTVGEGTPAAEAGMVPGTEILSINGESPADRYENIPLLNGLGTEEGRRVARSRYMLSFPADETITVEYRLPGESEVRTETFVTGPYESGGPTPTFDATPVSFEKRGPYAVVRWSDFVHDLQAKLAVLQEALGLELGDPSAGIIIDMRGNGGGWVPLYETMASHFFTADEPMPVRLFDSWAYDAAAGEHLRQFAPDYKISAPKPELAFTGPLVILVDETCISSCEYFTQHLQLAERATVIGQYRSAGAGGFIERVQLPGGNLFQFTQGRTTLAGTEEPNLEAKGVVPDIRVPVTLETELAKLRGEDPVMDAAIAELDRLTSENLAPESDGEAGEAGAQPVFASGKFWQWRSYLDPVNGETAIDDEQTYSFTLTDNGLAVLSGLCLAAVGSYERGDDTLSLTYDLPENMDETCEPGPNEARFFELMQGAARYDTEEDQLFIELAADGGTLVFDVLEDRSEDVEEAVTSVDLCGDAALNLNEIEATLDAQQVAALDELLPTYITEGSAIRPPAPGAALLVITPQGRYFKSVGVADVTSCEPLPADALFEIGSNTKMMTAAMIYQLQEEGVLSTSDLISQWVPEMAALVPNSDQITIDMLLTHTNGIYDYLNGTGNNGPLAAGATDRSVLTAAYTPEELVELAVTSGEPYFAPGEVGQWMYSNTGYILLGQIIEAATGKSYGENLEERIFQPLGLSRTFLEEGQPEQGLLPTGYLRSPYDYTTTEWNLSQGWSAGAVIADAQELAVFLKALFSGDLFQDPATLDLMLVPASTSYFEDDFYYGHGMFYKYGLLGHGGQALGYQSDVGYLPAEDITIVLWTNSAENTAGQAATAVGEALGIVRSSP